MLHFQKVCLGPSASLVILFKKYTSPFDVWSSYQCNVMSGVPLPMQS
uniref:Uncharacterized protein n=1 Tax=Setaria italica TaxID=4555 RepID=K3ZFU8_SETIT